MISVWYCNVRQFGGKHEEDIFLKIKGHVYFKTPSFRMQNLFYSPGTSNQTLCRPASRTEEFQPLVYAYNVPHRAFYLAVL